MTPIMRRPLDLKGLVVVLSTVLIWGTSYPMIKLGLADAPPLPFAAVRFFLAALLLAPWLPRKRAVYTPRLLAQATILGLFQCTLSFAFLFSGMTGISSSLASILFHSYPVWVAVLAPVVVNERFTKIQFAGLLASLLGLLVIFRESLRVDSAWSVTLTLVAALAWALAALLHRRFASPSPVALVALQSFSGSLLLAVSALLFTSDATIHLTWQFTLSLVYQVVMASSVAYLLWAWALPRYPARQVTSFAVLTPIISVAVGWFLLHEQLQVTLLVGGMLVVVGLIATTVLSI